MSAHCCRCHRRSGLTSVILSYCGSWRLLLCPSCFSHWDREIWEHLNLAGDGPSCDRCRKFGVDRIEFTYAQDPWVLTLCELHSNEWTAVIWGWLRLGVEVSDAYFSNEARPARANVVVPMPAVTRAAIPTEPEPGEGVELSLSAATMMRDLGLQWPEVLAEMKRAAVVATEDPDVARYMSPKLTVLVAESIREVRAIYRAIGYGTRGASDFALSFGLTDHARERMARRKITMAQIHATIDDKSAVVRGSANKPTVRVHQTRELGVVLDTVEHSVLTVYWRASEGETHGSQVQDPQSTSRAGGLA